MKAAITSERLGKEEVKVIEVGRHVLDQRKQVTCSGASIRVFSDSSVLSVI